MSKRIQVGGEEFEIEDPRLKRGAPKPLAPNLPVNDAPTDAPTQEERMEALKAIHTAHNHVRNLYHAIGGKKGSRLTSIALNYLDTALAVMLMHTTTTKTPWRGENGAEKGIQRAGQGANASGLVRHDRRS